MKAKYPKSWKGILKGYSSQNVRTHLKKISSFFHLKKDRYSEDNILFFGLLGIKRKEKSLKEFSNIFGGLKNHSFFRNSSVFPFEVNPVLTKYVFLLFIWLSSKIGERGFRRISAFPKKFQQTNPPPPNRANRLALFGICGKSLGGLALFEKSENSFKDFSRNWLGGLALLGWLPLLAGLAVFGVGGLYRGKKSEYVQN